MSSCYTTFWNGKEKDIRTHTLAQRQELLADLSKKIKGDGLPLLLSEVMKFSSWEKVAQERERAPELHSEGLMLKRKDSPYEVGRKKGAWWKWKSIQKQ